MKTIEKLARWAGIALVMGLLIGFVLARYRQRPENKSVTQSPLHRSAVPTDTLDVQVFMTENGWGYDVFVNHRRFIHQATIPVVDGNRGFKTRAQAQQVGDLVAQKMRRSRTFPTVSRRELDSLGVLP